jgi:peroxiredoxin
MERAVERAVDYTVKRAPPTPTEARTIGIMVRKLGICLWLALAWAGAANHVPRFSLADTAGQTHTPSEWAGKRAVVFFFLTTDCPLCNNYAPELNRIAQAFAPRGVAFYGVQGDATIPDEDVRRHARDYAYAFPYLFDPEESLAAFTGATATPEAAVLSPEGELLYLGRIDNRLEDFGKQRVQVTEFDLRDTLEAVLHGKPVRHSRTRALGCAITRKG